MTRIVVVTSPTCHFCQDAMDALEELSHEFAVEVVEVDIRSPESLAIVERFRPSMSPAVLVDDELFSVGRLPRKKLRRRLERSERAA